MPGLAAYDFGDSIRFGANDCAEDEPDQNKVHFDLHLFEVFAKASSRPLEQLCPSRKRAVWSGAQS